MIRATMIGMTTSVPPEGSVPLADGVGDTVEAAEATALAAALVVADDVRSYLVDWSAVPQPKRRDHVIAVLLVEDYNPPRNIKWKPFCDLVRDKCNGWLKPGKPALGFGDRQIKRAVNELRA